MENKIKKKLKIHLSKLVGSMNMFIFKNGLYLRINRYSQADFYQLRFQQTMQVVTVTLTKMENRL